MSLTLQPKQLAGTLDPLLPKKKGYSYQPKSRDHEMGEIQGGPEPHHGEKKIGSEQEHAEGKVSSTPKNGGTRKEKSG